MQDVTDPSPAQSGSTVHPAQKRSTKRARPEAGIQADILAALGLHPQLRLFRNNVGVATHHGAKVRYGLLPGSSDLIGIISPSGRLVSLEVKSDTGRLTEDQERWLHMVRRMGGFACVVRSVRDAQEAIARALRGATE